MTTNDKDYLEALALAEATGLRQSTVKIWTELGLLPFTQDGPRLRRHYPTKASLTRVKEIQKLKKTMTLKQIVEHFSK